jgi:hypothetical protein
MTCYIIENQQKFDTEGNLLTVKTVKTKFSSWANLGAGFLSRTTILKSRGFESDHTGNSYTLKRSGFKFIAEFSFCEDEDPNQCGVCLGKGVVRFRGDERSCAFCEGTGVNPKSKFYHSVASPPRKTVPQIPEAIYTVTGDSFKNQYRTIRIRSANFNGSPKTVVYYLSGSDNEENYTGCAFIENGQVRVWNRYKGTIIGEEIKMAVSAVAKDPKAAGIAYARVSGKCCVCNRTLTTPESIEAGIGPICKEKSGW